MNIGGFPASPVPEAPPDAALNFPNAPLSCSTRADLGPGHLWTLHPRGMVGIRQGCISRKPCVHGFAPSPPPPSPLTDVRPSPHGVPFWGQERVSGGRFGGVWRSYPIDTGQGAAPLEGNIWKDLGARGPETGAYWPVWRPHRGGRPPICRLRRARVTVECRHLLVVCWQGTQQCVV